MKVLVCFGTRPEAIKMAPVIHEMKKRGLHFNICVTAQHREMLDQVMEFFDIRPDYDLNLMKPGQSLNLLSAEIFKDFNEILIKENPDVILVQGDTTTAFVIAMAAFNSGIKLGHIEAGLRTHNLMAPFPEEANRQLISRIANYHFVPTKQAVSNLLNEMIPEEKIYFSGNTVVDSLEFGKQVLRSGYENEEIRFLQNMLEPEKKLILVTGHRRENFEYGLAAISEALIELSKREDVQIVFPVHPNPTVKKVVFDKLDGRKNILLTNPLNYPALLWMMNRSEFIISDSGGIQEEAPSFNKIVLVTREHTERMEGVEAGFCILTGPSRENLITESLKLLERKDIQPELGKNPYGDGKASGKIIDILLELKQ